MNEQIEVIRAEIERLQEIHERNLKKPMERGRIGYAHGVVACCDRILSFLDSLPEVPDKSLEEAAGEYNKQVIDETKCHHNALTYAEGYEDALLLIPDAFIAGAEWQKEQMMKDGNVILAEEDFNAEKEKSMEWGYNLCKDQMLKEAVEGTIYGCDGLHWIETDADENIKGKEGDKVRIIIVKEDAQ